MAALDSRELLLHGLIVALTPHLSGLVLPDNIHASWEQANLAGAIGTGPGEQSALVILDLGAETAQNPQPIRNERTVTLPAGVGASTTTQVIADQSAVAPLALICVAAGATAETTSGLIAATIKSLFGRGGTLSLPLPDDNSSDPPTFTYGLQATLLRTGGRPHTRDPIKGIYAYTVLATALYADYHTQTPTIARTVTLQDTFTEGLGSVSQTVNRTHS